MQLGTFKKSKDGYTGSIRTLKHKIEDVQIVKVAGPRKNDKAPDFRVLAEGGLVVGAGWTKAYGEGGKSTFVSVLVDDQSLDRAITGSLFDDKDGKTASLVWTRSARS